MIYELRYFFDAGSGICLWAANDAAREKFGYAVNHEDLSLSDNTRQWLQHLVSWFDTSLNWDNPADSNDPWTADERQGFMAASQRGLRLLREELAPSSFVIRDETAS